MDPFAISPTYALFCKNNSILNILGEGNAVSAELQHETHQLAEAAAP